MRWVLDTSVVTSALRSDSGAARLIVDAALAREVEILLSVPLVCEYEDVLSRPDQLAAAGLSARQISEFLETIVGVGLQVILPEYRGPRSIDPDDDHILNLASEGEADAILSYNTRHFAAACRALRIELFTPAEGLRFLRRFGG